MPVDQHVQHLLDGWRTPRTGHVDLHATRLLSAVCARQDDGQRGRPPDSNHRVFVDKRVWREVVTALADEIEYDNFKSEVAHHQWRAGAAYADALQDVWGVMYRLRH